MGSWWFEPEPPQGSGRDIDQGSGASQAASATMPVTSTVGCIRTSWRQRIVPRIGEIT